MTEDEIKLWTALAAALASLIVALIAHFSNRTNQRAIEHLRNEYAEERAERDAKRDYQYEARKRLYQECGPVLFQLAELCEAAYHRIIGLADTASQGNLEPGSSSYLRDEYYKLSTIYRLLGPSAALKLLQRHLTLVDLSLDLTIQRQYILIRQAFFAFGGEFTFARMAKHPLEYLPFDTRARSKSLMQPAIYSRQGLPLGVMEGPIEAIITSGQEHQSRVMTYAECEAEYNKRNSRLHKELDAIAFLIEDFHPRSRPVLWRMLVTQACIYRVLSEPRELQKEQWGLPDLRVPQSEMKKFDWRSKADEQFDDSVVFEPLDIAAIYCQERIEPLLQRMAINRDTSVSRRSI